MQNYCRGVGMMFSVDWVITNPVQTIDSGIKVIFDSEPILAAITIVTFLIVAFFVWNKNKVKLHKMVHDRKPMENVRIDVKGLKEELDARAKVQAPPQGIMHVETHVEKEPPKEHPVQDIDGVGDEPKDELIDWFLDQYTDDDEEKKEMMKPPEIDNQQHTYEAEKTKETPRERMKRLWAEGKLKGRPKKDENK